MPHQRASNPSWRTYFPEEHYELYDLNTDPGENKNLFHSAKPLSLKLSLLLHSKLTEMRAVQPVSGQ
ncbi:MAG: hypothetical protein GWO81_01740 [Verrucomicrobia bacterium]|nr:hypothetical protein [Verrucomicrobiota bacterium]